jgi:hypothetical protein
MGGRCYSPSRCYAALSQSIPHIGSVAISLFW